MDRFFVLGCLLLLVCVLSITGCAALDSAVGLDPTTGDRRDGNPAETAGGLLGAIGGPWGTLASGILGSLATGYAALRSRRYSRLSSSLVRGTNVLLRQAEEGGKVNLDRNTLLKILSEIQDEDGTRKTADQVIAKVKKGKS